MSAAVAWRVVILVSGLVAGLGACRGPGNSSSERAVTAAVEYLLEKDNAGDLEGVLEGYTEDVVWMPPKEDMIQGKAAVRARYVQLFSTYEVKFRAEIAEARSDGRYGYARGHVRGTLTPKDGGEPVVVEDKFLAIARREGRTWRVSRLMWSPRAETR